MSNENMQDLFENMQDLYDKFLEAQEDMFEYDVPDSFQIAGIEEEDLCDQCSSADTYLSVATAYNTVRVCKDCGHEEHTPSVR